MLSKEAIQRKKLIIDMVAAPLVFSDERQQLQEQISDMQME